MTLTVVKMALIQYLSLYILRTISSTRNNTEPISLIGSEKLAIKHLSNGVHFIGVPIFSVHVLKYLLIFVQSYVSYVN
jgi:hypothetical protein